MSRRSPCRTRCTCTAPAQVDHLPTRPWAHCQRRWSVDRPWWVCARQGSGALPPEVQRPVWYATHAACTWRTWQAHRRLTPASDDRTARTPISTLALSWLHCTAIPAPLGQNSGSIGANPITNANKPRAAPQLDLPGQNRCDRKIRIV